MDASSYRIRPLQAADIDTVLELMAQANPAYDAQSLVAHRHMLELATAPDGTSPSMDSLRVMAQELASDALDADIAVAPALRRQGIGSELLNAVLNSDSATARKWRLALWFFHEGMGMGGFHRTMAPEWPAGQPITFLDSEGQAAPLRELSGDLRACVAPMHPDLKLVRDPKGVAAIRGVFEHP